MHRHLLATLLAGTVLAANLAAAAGLTASPTGLDALAAHPVGATIAGHDLAGLPEEPLSRAVALALLVGDAQTAALDLHPVATLAATAAPMAPSEALATLAARHGVAPDAEATEAIARLDALPAATRDALSGFLGAFLAFDAAARAHQAALAGGGGPAAVAPVVAARADLLVAALALRDALAAEPAARAVPPIVVAPAFALDLAGVDSSYADDVALLLDVGGSDVYLNNAGGSGLRLGLDLCGLLAARGAAALVDLGPESDVFGDAASPRLCGANGGGYWGGVGLLVSEGGDDLYAAAHSGTNGGGRRGGIGLVVDAAGHDRYLAGNAGANGGAEGGLESHALGGIVDASGNDVYRAENMAVNGGALIGGIGVILDAEGDDDYTGRDRSANGAGVQTCLALVLVCPVLAPPLGLLADLAGSDRYADPAIPGGACADCSIVPKTRGVAFGAQVDLPGGA